jgi:hypothetical protein
MQVSNDIELQKHALDFYSSLKKGDLKKTLEEVKEVLPNSSN